MEKTLMGEGFELSTQEAEVGDAGEVGDVVTLEVAIETGVDLVVGDHLVPRLATVWSLRTSHPRPPGRT